VVHRFIESASKFKLSNKGRKVVVDHRHVGIEFEYHSVADGVKEEGVAELVDHGELHQGFASKERESVKEDESLHQFKCKEGSTLLFCTN